MNLHYVGWFHQVRSAVTVRKQKSLPPCQCCCMERPLWVPSQALKRGSIMNIDLTLERLSTTHTTNHTFFHLHLQPDCQLCPFSQFSFFVSGNHSFDIFSKSIENNKRLINFDSNDSQTRRAFLPDFLCSGALCCQSELRCAVHPVHGNSSSLCVVNGQWWNHPLPNTTPKQYYIKNSKNRYIKIYEEC